jgi:hypothetical protein
LENLIQEKGAEKKFGRVTHGSSTKSEFTSVSAKVFLEKWRQVRCKRGVREKKTALAPACHTIGTVRVSVCSSL